jgi:hypothetical protein
MHSLAVELCVERQLAPQNAVDDVRCDAAGNQSRNFRCGSEAGAGHSDSDIRRFVARFDTRRYASTIVIARQTEQAAERGKRFGVIVRELTMKSVTIVFAAAFTLMSAGITGAAAHPDRQSRHATAVVSDIPLARPAVPRLSAATPNAAETRYFYAPGSGPRCEIVIKRAQDRLYQSCE